MEVDEHIISEIKREVDEETFVDEESYISEDNSDSTFIKKEAFSEGEETAEDEGQRIPKSESVPIFETPNPNERLDSDYEPVTEYDASYLKEKLRKKTDDARRNEKLYCSLLEMKLNQDSTITALENELKQLQQESVDDNEEKGADSDEDVPLSQIKERLSMEKFGDLDLQVFSISLYYFSPKVYGYLSSMIPHLPPKSVIIDWVKNGHVLRLFPKGTLNIEKFCFD